MTVTSVPVPPLTIKRMHTLQHAAYRNGGIYHISGEMLHLTVQDNAFSSCGINLIFGLSGLDYTPLHMLDPLMDVLRDFKDDNPAYGGYKARRFLIQPNQRHLKGSKFVGALLERPECEKICEYDNLAHSSDKQYLYMLAFK